jgi:hypothetical protein
MRTKTFKSVLAVALAVLIGATTVAAKDSADSAKTLTASTTLPAQIPVLCFHGIGTPSSVTGSVANYNVTLSNFKAEMAALHAAGYATIDPAQYEGWLAGTNDSLPAKPILITFDDAFSSDTQATPVLQSYGYHAVMFVVTGYADGAYNGIDDSGYAPWSVVSALTAQGWYLQFHAGLCGHAYMPYAPASCLTGLDTSTMDSSHFQYYIWNFGQTDAQYEARVTAEITAGEADLALNAGFPDGWKSTLFAAPFGAWTNGANAWLDTYWDSQFQTIFVQNISKSSVTAARQYHVRFRLELGYKASSASYLMNHISNITFTRAGPTGAVSNPASIGGA